MVISNELDSLFDNNTVTSFTVRPRSGALVKEFSSESVDVASCQIEPKDGLEACVTIFAACDLDLDQLRKQVDQELQKARCVHAQIVTSPDEWTEWKGEAFEEMTAIYHYLLFGAVSVELLPRALSCQLLSTPAEEREGGAKVIARATGVAAMDLNLLALKKRASPRSYNLCNNVLCGLEVLADNESNSLIITLPPSNTAQLENCYRILKTTASVPPKVTLKRERERERVRQTTSGVVGAIRKRAHKMCEALTPSRWRRK
jgi:hypothetical protein